VKNPLQPDAFGQRKDPGAVPIVNPAIPGWDIFGHCYLVGVIDEMVFLSRPRPKFDAERNKNMEKKWDSRRPAGGFRRPGLMSQEPAAFAQSPLVGLVDTTITSAIGYSRGGSHDSSAQLLAPYRAPHPARSRRTVKKNEIGSVF
jgi:hypothetical protein